MKALGAVAIVMVVAGIVIWILWSDTTAGQGIALSLVGIASVLGVSGVFLLVGQSEDEERAAAARPREASPPPASESRPPASELSEPRVGSDPHARPALDRRRPLPPRRPS